MFFFLITNIILPDEHINLLLIHRFYDITSYRRNQIAGVIRAWKTIVSGSATNFRAI